MSASLGRGLAGSVIVLAAIAAYANTFGGEWVWDDASSVLLHRNVQDPGRFFQLFREDQHAFGRGQGNFYRPLVSASFMLDYAVTGGPSPAEIEAAGKPPLGLPTVVFHFSNLLWHGAAALLLYLLLLRAGAPISAAAVAGLVFVAHPLHTEAVAYISGRADMMSAAFMFAGMILALTSRTGGRRWAAWCGSLACFAAALMSKESSLIYPVLLGILLVAAWLQERQLAVKGDKGCIIPRLFPLVGAVLLLVVYVALRSTVLRFAASGATAAAPLGQRMQETGQAFALYLKLLFWPAGLHMERTLDGIPGWLGPVGWALLVGIVLAALAAFSSRKYRIAAGLAWFLAAWVPISGIFPLNAPMAEHWMYVPMAGFWWAVGEGLVLACERPRLRWMPLMLAGAACVLLVALTAERNRDWHDDERLFVSTLEKNPNSVRVHYNLAVTYEDILKNYAGARRHYEAILRLQGQEGSAKPARPATVAEGELRLALGHVLEKMGNPAAAAEQFQKLLNVKSNAEPGMALEAAMGFGRCFLAMGDWPSATQLFAQVVKKASGAGPEVQRLLAGAPFSGDF